MTVPASSGAIDTASRLRDAAGSQSRAAGSIIDTLDSLALTIGETRISLWDSIVIAGVILFGIMLAWSTSKVCGSLLRRMTRLDDTQRILTSKITTILIWGFTFFLGIDLLGIDLT